jgi:SAM-dependent methyltransferase
VEPGEYQRMFELEDHYWWFRAKRALVQMLIDDYAPRRGAGRLVAVDVGCGTGGPLASFAARGGRWVGTDRSELALAFCRRRRVPRLFQATAEAIPLRSGCADLVLCLDVMYHRNVQDDTRVLSEVVRLLAPNGTTIITDSALNWLRGPHDEAVHTRKRYSLGEMTRMVEAAGLQIVKRSYANSLIFPLTVAQRLARRLAPATTTHSDLVEFPRPIAAALGAVQATERWLLRRMSLPIGTTVVVVARKAA